MFTHNLMTCARPFYSYASTTVQSQSVIDMSSGAAKCSPLAGALDRIANGGGAPVPAARPASASRMHPGCARGAQDLVSLILSTLYYILRTVHTVNSFNIAGTEVHTNMIN